MTQEFKTPHPIEIELFSKRTNKTTKLINSKDGFSVEGSHRWYEFQFKEPVFISQIEIQSEGYDSWHKFEMEVTHVDGTIHQERLSVESNVVDLLLGKLAAEFRFRPEARWVSKTSIIRVVVHGYTLSEFHELEWTVKELQSRESAIALQEARIGSLDSKENLTKDKIAALTSEIGKLEARQSELTKSVSSLDANVVERRSASKDLQSEIENFQERNRSIRSEISENTNNLNELKTKIRLFPSEVAGFVAEGTRNIRTYLLLSVPFIIVFFVVLTSLFSSAVDLTQLWRKEQDVDVWTIFLTRIPFIVVAFALIEAAGFIVGRLVFEVIKINRQRLEFSKLSIIAKDVVTATSAELDMDEEERFSEELKLKMKLLQEHMKSQSNEEFQYSGSAITSAIIGVANRLAGGRDKSAE